MGTLVSITTQGQLTIPKNFRDEFGIAGSTKAILEKEGNTIIVKPKTGFWDLAGSIESKIKLTDKQLRKARDSFATNWARND